MKINTKSWHYKVFSFFNHYPCNFYEHITDCMYVSKVLLHLFILIVGIPFVALIAFVFISATLEPVLVIGNWFIGNGFEPVLGQYARNKEDVFGLFYAGSVIWFLAIMITGSHYFNKWAATLTYADAPKTSFSRVLYLRVRGWKDKICHPVEFVDN